MPREPFQFDLSAAKDKKRRQRGRRGMSGAVETSSRTCEHPGCSSEGKFRAPKSPDRTAEFHWFCRKHVKEYNVRWDFFKAQADNQDDNGTGTESESDDGLSPEDRRIRREKLAWSRLGIKDPFEILGENATVSDRARTASSRRLTRNERRAINILDAKEGWGKSEIRKQYRSLVKDLHPDMNDGDRSDEERLKEVVWAWDQIKDSHNFD